MAPYQNQGVLLTLALIAVVNIMGCLFLSEESRYLSAAKNRATEADVRHHLGEPAHVTSDKNGKTIWIYKTRKYVQEGTNNECVDHDRFLAVRYLWRNV